MVFPEKIGAGYELKVGCMHSRKLKKIRIFMELNGLAGMNEQKKQNVVIANILFQPGATEKLFCSINQHIE